MSNLKKDIEKILKDFVLWRTKIIDGKPVATYDKNMLSEWENKNMLSEWEREQYQPMEAVTQIINLIESVIPEEKKLPTIDGVEITVGVGRIQGYNQAIRDIKNKLIGGN